MQVEAGSLHEHCSDFLRLWKCLDCVRHVAGWKYHQGTVMLDSILICSFFFCCEGRCFVCRSWSCMRFVCCAFFTCISTSWRDAVLGVFGFCAIYGCCNCVCAVIMSPLP